MKAIIIIKLEFESWFEEERRPKTKEEWIKFFINNLIPEGSILGVDDGEFQDIIALESFTIEDAIVLTTTRQ